MPFELAMTSEMTPTIAETPIRGRKSGEKRRVAVEEIVESLRSAGEDIEQIGKLVLKEQRLVKQLFAALKYMQPLASSIPVSTAVLPVWMRGVTEAYIDYSGYLSLTFEDGHRRLRDLTEGRNIDLMLTVVSDIAPKFESLVAEATEEIASPPAVEAPAASSRTLSATNPNARAASVRAAACCRGKSACHIGGCCSCPS